MIPRLASQIPRKKGGVDSHLKPNSQNIKNYYTAWIQNQILQNGKDHQILFVGRPNLRTGTTNPRWRMAIILKKMNRCITATP